MTSVPGTLPQSAPRFPESGPDFAESAQPPKSGIWLLCRFFNGLDSALQISEATFRNLPRNLEFISKINGFEQISDFGFLPLTGRCHPLKPGVAPSREPAWLEDG
jgi:hypothetical protein